MANESNSYNQFSNFNCRKIFLAMIERENKEGPQESANPVDKMQLIKNFFQKVNDLFPLQPGTTLDSIVVQFYYLKKEIMNLDPNWKFMTSDNQYLANILPLLDAINIESEENIPDVTRCVKICQRLYHATRIRKKENPLWNFDVEKLVDFLYPNLNSVNEYQPSILEDREKIDEK
jgi:hypothetical protein